MTTQHERRGGLRPRPPRTALVTRTSLVAAAAVAALVLGACGVPGAMPGAVQPTSGTGTSQVTAAETPASTSPAGDTDPATATSSQPAPTASPLVQDDGYVAKDSQQSTDCDGLPAVPMDQLRRLRAGTEIASAVVCTTTTQRLPGKGLWEMNLTISVPENKLPALVEALTEPEVPPVANGACTAMLVMVPSFVLTLPDGTRIRPGVPGNMCHPLQGPLDVIGALIENAGPADTRATPSKQVATELEAASGCYGGANSPDIWQQASGSAEPAAPPDKGNLSVCRYRPDAGSPESGTLAAAGVVPAATLAGYLTPGALTDTCPAPAADAPDHGGWLTVVTTPAQDASPEDIGAVTYVAVIGLDGCRPVVSPTAGLLGYLTPAQAETLAALASEAATQPAG